MKNFIILAKLKYDVLLQGTYRGQKINISSAKG